MARLAKVFYRGGFVGVGSWNVVATVPAAKKWEVLSVHLCNIGSVSRIAQVQFGGVQVMWVSLAAGTSQVLSMFTVLNDGEHISLQGNNADLSLYSSGVEVDV